MTCRVRWHGKRKPIFSMVITIFLLITVIVYPQSIVLASAEVKLVIPDMEISPGERTEITLTVENIPTPGLAGYDLSINYNSSVIKVTLVDSATDFPKPAVNQNAGTLHLAAAQANGKSGTLTLAKLEVEAIGSAGSSTPLQVNSIDLIRPDVKSIPVILEHGLVKIKGVSTPPSGSPGPSNPLIPELRPLPGQPPVHTHYAGNDRFETAKLIALGTYPGPHQKKVYVANAYAPADALAGAPLAYKNKAPLLLGPIQANSAKGLSDYVKAAMDPDSEIILLGGSGVLDETYVQSYTQQTDRLGGQNREETAVQIARQLLGTVTGNPVVIVNSDGFADAISIAPIAAQMGWPILLTPGEQLSSVTAEFLMEEKPSQIVIVGGAGVVSDKVFTSLGKYTRNIERIWGKDRFETNAEVLKKYAGEAESIAFANGDGDYPIDALAGASLGIPIILVQGQEEMNPAQRDYLKDLGQVPSRIFGGSGVIRQDLSWD